MQISQELDEEYLDISIENNHLLIKGHREKKDEIKTATQHHLERSLPRTLVFP